MNSLRNQDHQFIDSDCLLDVKKQTINLKSLGSRFKSFCIQNAVLMIENPLSDVAACSGAEKFGPDLAVSTINIYARRVSTPAIYQHPSIKE
jgi:hypothetical protein